jgi:pimeloyl-ACP methyl ester carboxylesterase
MWCNLKTIAFSIIICLLAITACAEKEAPPTVNVEATQSAADRFQLEYYPHYETLYLQSGKGYEFKNPNSKKLLIIMSGGPSWQAKVGKEGKIAAGYRVIDWFLPFYLDYNYTIFVPEHFDWEEEETDYYWNIPEERERVTFDSVQTCYEEVISEYLSQNDYETIIIAGHSEGGMHLPMVYSRLENPGISALIAMSYGGLSKYEDYEVSFSKQQAGEIPYEIQDHWANLRSGVILKALLDYAQDKPRNDSIDRFPRTSSRITYRWLNSILEKRPFDYYVNINIPVLFLHGERDGNVSVESTRYVEANLPDKPFDYIYYSEGAHGPGTREGLNILRNDIKEWLISKGF